jgi:outer membrane lipoprotein-sorting protein
MFTPEIPAGFVNAHPDEIRAAREKQRKGRMDWADVPGELKEEIFAALRKIKTTVYREHYEVIPADGSRSATPEQNKVYLSRYAWRKDNYDQQGRLGKTEWFVIEKGDWGKTSLDFNDKDFRLTQTIVNFGDNTYKVVAHRSKSRPRHPMDGILFLAGLADRADRELENARIEGVECFGLEISATKYGTNPPHYLHRLWFDAESKLPVRMEFERRQKDSNDKDIKVIYVRDHFEWNPDLPTDTFDPKIPEGFKEMTD